MATTPTIEDAADTSTQNPTNARPKIINKGSGSLPWFFNFGNRRIEIRVVRNAGYFFVPGQSFAVRPGDTVDFLGNNLEIYSSIEISNQNNGTTLIKVPVYDHGKTLVSFKMPDLSNVIPDGGFFWVKLLSNIPGADWTIEQNLNYRAQNEEQDEEENKQKNGQANEKQSGQSSQSASSKFVTGLINDSIGGPVKAAVDGYQSARANNSAPNNSIGVSPAASSRQNRRRILQTQDDGIDNSLDVDSSSESVTSESLQSGVETSTVANQNSAVVTGGVTTAQSLSGEATASGSVNTEVGLSTQAEVSGSNIADAALQTNAAVTGTGVSSVQVGGLTSAHVNSSTAGAASSQGVISPEISDQINPGQQASPSLNVSGSANAGVSSQNASVSQVGGQVGTGAGVSAAVVSAAASVQSPLAQSLNQKSGAPQEEGEPAAIDANSNTKAVNGEPQQGAIKTTPEATGSNQPQQVRQNGNTADPADKKETLSATKDGGKSNRSKSLDKSGAAAGQKGSGLEASPPKGVVNLSDNLKKGDAALARKLNLPINEPLGAGLKKRGRSDGAGVDGALGAAGIAQGKKIDSLGSAANESAGSNDQSVADSTEKNPDATLENSSQNNPTQNTLTQPPANNNSDQKENVDSNSEEQPQQDNGALPVLGNLSLPGATNAATEEAIKLVNEFINGVLIDAALWVWVLAVPTFGATVLLGTIAGDFLFLFKDALINFAIKRVSLPLLKGDLLQNELKNIKGKIKFSTTVKVNVFLMNLVILIALFIIFLFVVVTIKGLCDHLITGVSIDTLINSNICKIVDGFTSASQNTIAAPYVPLQ